MYGHFYTKEAKPTFKHLWNWPPVFSAGLREYFLQQKKVKLKKKRYRRYGTLLLENCNTDSKSFPHFQKGHLQTPHRARMRNLRFLFDFRIYTQNNEINVITTGVAKAKSTGVRCIKYIFKVDNFTVMLHFISTSKGFHVNPGWSSCAMWLSDKYVERAIRADIAKSRQYGRDL